MKHGGGVSGTRLNDERLGDESAVGEKSSGMEYSEVMVVVSSKDGERDGDRPVCGREEV